MAVTIKKIAELAGVSAGTVDRVLNNRGKVKPEVDARVRQIAKSLKYQPNKLGRSLSMVSRKLKIAVILHCEGNLYFDYILKGVRKAGAEILHNGCSVAVYYGKNFDAGYQCTQIDKAVSEGSDAIIIVPIEDEVVKRKLTGLSLANYPIYLLSNPLSDTAYCSYVGCDYYQAGNLAAGCAGLLCTENSKIAFFSPSFQMLGHRLRLEGFVNNPAIKAKHAITDTIELKEDGALSIYGIVLEYLKTNHDVSVIVTHGAVINEGVLRALEETGLLGKVKIIVYDFSESVKKMLESDTAVFCIDQSPEEQGYMIVKAVYNDFLSQTFPDCNDCFVPLRILIKESLDDRVDDSQINNAM